MLLCAVQSVILISASNDNTHTHAYAHTRVVHGHERRIGSSLWAIRAKYLQSTNDANRPTRYGIIIPESVTSYFQIRIHRRHRPYGSAGQRRIIYSFPNRSIDFTVFGRQDVVLVVLGCVRRPVARALTFASFGTLARP